MTRPVYKPEISLGTLIQIAVILFTVGVAWSNVDGKTKANAESILRVDAYQRETAARQDRDMQSAKLQIRSLETASARADERYDAIYNLLARIETRLERIEETGNGR